MNGERYRWIIEELENMTVDGYDIEIGHQRGDDYLREVALDDSLDSEQRKAAVDLWDEIEKWYA